MIKFIVVVLCVLAGFCTIANGDTITLRTDNKDIELKVTGVTGEYINAILLRKDIKSLNMQFSNDRNYPDLVFLNIANASVECKIKEITEDTVQLQIPTAAISSLQMSFASGYKQAKTAPEAVESNAKMVDAVAREEKTEQREERVPESGIREDAGGGSGIADEIRTSTVGKTLGGKDYRLRTKKSKTENSGREDDLAKPETVDVPATESAMNEETQEADRETSAPKQEPPKDSQGEGKAVEEGLNGGKNVIQDSTLGRVEGKILQSGKPLPGCQVKLQMLEKSGLLAKGYRPVAGAAELEVVTDENGIYHFMNVSPALYKLYWKPPSESAWVRRFKMEPDVIVNSGKRTTPKDIETLKRTLN